MSTEIEDLRGGYGPRLLSADEDEVQISTCRTPRGRDVIAVTPTMDRAAFIAAVETECDGIFIPRAELPEVTERAAHGGTVLIVEGDPHTEWGVGGTPEHIAARRREAYRNLALIEYAQNRPPVDEAKVHELAMALVSDPAIVGHRATFATDDIARRLVEQGWSR